MGRIRRILHATDFSSASNAAFGKAVELAKANGAQLYLVHVLTPVVPLAGDGYVSPTVYADIEASTRAAADKQMSRLAAKARQAGVTRVHTLLLEGVAHDRIARAARSRRADMIVIGTHGRTGLAKLFLGSVAGRVVAAASCPVLTVRGR
jgi:nucleotide-binding universal stress UspA family protein